MNDNFWIVAIGSLSAVLLYLIHKIGKIVGMVRSVDVIIPQVELSIKMGDEDDAKKL